MSKNGSTIIRSCPFCEQGLIRIAVCRVCDQASALCDECEAVWAHPRLIAEDPAAPADCQHPGCPHCSAETTTWTFPDATQVTQLGFGDLMSGRSDA